jgi:5-methylcytosine-specific restriction protein A
MPRFVPVPTSPDVRRDGRGRIRRTGGWALQQLRRRWFTAHPLCVHCLRAGRIRLATELDHIVPLLVGGADDDTNRQGLCHTCHEAKTAIDLGRGPVRGCDASGMPIDAAHHWHRPVLP